MDEKNKKDIIDSMMNIEYYPVTENEEVKADKYVKIPLSEISAFGVAFSSLPESFRTIAQTINTGGGQQLYKAVFPSGVSGHLAEFKNGSGYLGTIMNSNGIVGQARLIPAGASAAKISTVVPYDPTMIFMAVALASVNHKLESIQETQQKIINFLAQSNEAQLRTDLQNLADVQNNYKYNCDNEKYVSSKLNLVQDIKREAKKNIDFYQVQIKEILDKKQIIHRNQDTKDKLKKIISKFQYYHLAVYLYSFSTFLEVMLLGNFNAEYLKNVVNDIKERAGDYQSLYDDCYEQIEKHANASIESKLVKGVSHFDKVTGEAVAKMPIISKTLIDETLIGASDLIDDFDAKKIDKILGQFNNQSSSGIEVFIENINTVNYLYNKPIQLIFDQDNIYLEKEVA